MFSTAHHSSIKERGLPHSAWCYMGGYWRSWGCQRGTEREDSCELYISIVDVFPIDTESLIKKGFSFIFFALCKYLSYSMHDCLVYTDTFSLTLIFSEFRCRIFTAGFHLFSPKISWSFSAIMYLFKFFCAASIHSFVT